MVQNSPPVIMYVASLNESQGRIADLSHYWMAFVHNQCTSKAHVIVVGSHADTVKGGKSQEENSSMFARIIGKFKKLKYIDFLPMDCSSLDSNLMETLQQSCDILRSPETISIKCSCLLHLSSEQP